ncbi:General transcription factor 3C polypeptide 3, partial [Fragariocoptes setiger]
MDQPGTSSQSIDPRAIFDELLRQPDQATERQFRRLRSRFSSLVEGDSSDESDNELTYILEKTPSPDSEGEVEGLEHFMSGDRDDDKKGRTVKSKLPRDLVGLMGQANLSFARGNSEDGIKMCMEVIRLAPQCPEPFDSLGMHYESLGDEEKALQCFLTTAYLKPSDGENWIRAAKMAEELKNYRLASTCYTKAIKAFPEKTPDSRELHWRRCDMYEKLGDKKRALKGYERLVGELDASKDGHLAMNLSRGISRIHVLDNNIAIAARCLETAIERYPNETCREDYENLAKFNNISKEYVKTLSVITNYCKGVSISFYKHPNYTINSLHDSAILEAHPPIRIILPRGRQSHTHKKEDSFDTAFRAMFCEALISLNYTGDVIKPLISSILSAEFSKYLDHMINLSRALIRMSCLQEVKQILSCLIVDKNCQTATVWLLYSECLQGLEEIDAAIDAYKKVVDLNPEDFNSKLALSSLFMVKGRIEEAIQVTEQKLSTDTAVDLPLLQQRIQLLDKAQYWDQYLTCARAILMTDMVYLQYTKEFNAVIASRLARTRSENLRDVHKELGIDTNQRKQKFSGHKLDADIMIRIFVRLLQILYHELKDHEELLKICFSAYTSNSLLTYEETIDFLSVMACYKTCNTEHTYLHVKNLALKNPENNQIWNILSSSMISIYKDLRHNRFCLRLFIKHNEILALAYLNGHNAFTTGSYKYALGEYMGILREHPDDPLAALFVGLTFLNLACQKFVSNKYLCVYQMVAFMNLYLKLRGTCEESMYNIGRSFHQLNMLGLATNFYKRALDISSRIMIENMSQDEAEKIFTLRHTVDVTIVVELVVPAEVLEYVVGAPVVVDAVDVVVEGAVVDVVVVGAVDVVVGGVDIEVVSVVAVVVEELVGGDVDVVDGAFVVVELWVVAVLLVERAVVDVDVGSVVVVEAVVLVGILVVVVESVGVVVVLTEVVDIVAGLVVGVVVVEAGVVDVEVKVLVEVVVIGISVVLDRAVVVVGISVVVGLAGIVELVVVAVVSGVVVADSVFEVVALVVDEVVRVGTTSVVVVVVVRGARVNGRVHSVVGRSLNPGVVGIGVVEVIVVVGVAEVEVADVTGAIVIVCVLVVEVVVVWAPVVVVVTTAVVVLVGASVVVVVVLRFLSKNELNFSSRMSVALPLDVP